MERLLFNVFKKQKNQLPPSSAEPIYLIEKEFEKIANAKSQGKQIALIVGRGNKQGVADTDSKKHYCFMSTLYDNFSLEKNLHNESYFICSLFHETFIAQAKELFDEIIIDGGTMKHLMMSSEQYTFPTCNLIMTALAAKACVTGSALMPLFTDTSDFSKLNFEPNEDVLTLQEKIAHRMKPYVKLTHVLKYISRTERLRLIYPEYELAHTPKGYDNLICLKNRTCLDYEKSALVLRYFLNVTENHTTFNDLEDTTMYCPRNSEIKDSHANSQAANVFTTDNITVTVEITKNYP